MCLRLLKDWILKSRQLPLDFPMIWRESGSRGRSVSIVSDYGLDDWGSIPDRGRRFSSSLCFQTGSGAHPASCPMGTGALSPGEKRVRDVMLTTQPHLVPRLRMSRSYTSSHPMRLHGMQRDLFTFKERVGDHLMSCHFCLTNILRITILKFTIIHKACFTH
jgi:hypothetical protein